MLLTIEYEENMTSYVDLLILIGSLGAMMWGMMKFLLREIHTDLTELKESHKRSEERIDHLYQICVDMLRDRK